MRRTATEIIRALEIRVARLEIQASNFEYKTIVTQQGRKINLSRGSSLFLAFVDSEGNLKPVSWKVWSKSNLPDRSSEYTRDEMRKSLLSKAKSKMNFGELMEVNNFRGDFMGLMDWMSSKGITVSARGVKLR
jgi:hypothetical protein